MNDPHQPTTTCTGDGLWLFLESGRCCVPPATY
jgi:hypothetical protein